MDKHIYIFVYPRVEKFVLVYDIRLVVDYTSNPVEYVLDLASTMADWPEDAHAVKLSSREIRLDFRATDSDLDDVIARVQRAVKLIGAADRELSEKAGEVERKFKAVAGVK
jgi:hypothetical protein